MVVGNGRPSHAQRFGEAMGVDFPLLVDPQMHAYRAAGLRRSLWRTVGPTALKAAIAAWRSGHRQHRTQGDPWQQGGTFVVAPGGKVLFEHVSRAAGDAPDFRRVVERIRARATRSGDAATRR